MIKHIHAATGVLLFLVLAVAATPAFGAEAKSMLSWEPPTTRGDGTPLGAEEIAGYRLFHRVDGSITADGEYIILEPFQKAEQIVLDLSPREKPYTVNFAIATVDTDGRISPLSDTVSKTFDIKSTADPEAPTTLEVTITCGDGCTIGVAE